jgi:AbiV family abortive infection protein
VTFLPMYVNVLLDHIAGHLSAWEAAESAAGARKDLDLGPAEFGTTILLLVTESGNAAPGSQILLSFASASMINARDLLGDAQILLQASRWPTAYALAVLSAEEFGKAGLAMRLFTMPRDDLEQIAVRRLTGDHQVKLEAAYQHEGFAAPSEQWLDDILRVPAEAGESHRRKLRGLYVDYSKDGSIQYPTDVTEEEARCQVSRVQAMLAAPFWNIPILRKPRSEK